MRELKMFEHKSSGLLITFCGLDGCGKTTMIDMLTKRLSEENDVFLTKQPTQFVRNSDIFRNYMDSEEHGDYEYRSLSLLAASDRVQHVNKVILPQLNNSKMVISDRYFYSCLANLRARGYKKDCWIYDVSKAIAKPDVAFFLDVPVDVAISRVRSRQEEKDRYIDLELQHRLRQEYIDICNANNGVLLSTEQSPEDTFDKVMCEVNRVLIQRNGVDKQVFDILSELSSVEVNDISQSLASDIGLDSLGLVTLLLQLEEEFGICFDESDMNPYDLTDAGDVVALVKKYGVGKK